jgi:hypothetical protein
MQKETRNNRSDWRERLGDLEAQPGEAAWDKLHLRLANKKRNNKPVWWFLAAACAVAIFFLLSFFKSDNKIGNEIVKEAKKYNSKIILTQPLPIVKREAHFEKKVSLKPAKIDMPVKKKDTAIQIVQASTVDPEKNISLTAIEIPFAAPKKKLRVVHINELQPEDTGEKQDWAQHDKTKTKRTKNKNLIHSYVTNSTSDKALKISLSPSN